MKKTFKLIYSYGAEIPNSSCPTDEYFCQEHNVTLAKEKLLSMLKSNQKPISLCEYVKHKGWKINRILNK